MTDSTRWPPKDYDGTEDEEAERALQEEIDDWEAEVGGTYGVHPEDDEDDLDFGEVA